MTEISSLGEVRYSRTTLSIKVRMNIISTIKGFIKIHSLRIDSLYYKSFLYRGISMQYTPVVSLRASSNISAFSFRVLAALLPCFLTRSLMVKPRSIASHSRNAADIPMMTWPERMFYISMLTLFSSTCHSDAVLPDDLPSLH